MKVIVLKEFIDRETKAYHKTGKRIELSDSRTDELISKGFVKAVEEKTQKKQKKNG